MQTKSIDFSGMEVYVGIDVHKKSWSVTVLTEDVEHKTFTQPPEVEVLVTYLRRHFPGALYKSAYEAGISGFGPHRRLRKLGVENIVVNPADVPSTGREKAGKTDRVDSRKLARGLRNGSLTGIHVLSESAQELRTLARMRHILQKDLRRYKQRIKMLLLNYTKCIPEEYDNEQWSLGFERWLEEVEFTTVHGRQSLDYLIAGYRFHKDQVRQVSNKLRSHFRKHYKKDYTLLRTIPGIGPLSAIRIITEIGDIHRFGNTDQLCSYAGLVPLMHSSGETDHTGGVTYRSNPYLRVMLVESSWQAIRRDPALLVYYRQHAARQNGKKAIVKVARKLLCRIRYVLQHKEPYELGVVG